MTHPMTDHALRLTCKGKGKNPEPPSPGSRVPVPGFPGPGFRVPGPGSRVPGSG